jgi:hypothetical protein
LSTPNWAQPLPRPIIIPQVMELDTLDDVRALIEKHLPAEYRAKFTWRQLAGMLRRAAQARKTRPRYRLRCRWRSSSRE